MKCAERGQCRNGMADRVRQCEFAVLHHAKLVRRRRQQQKESMYTQIHHDRTHALHLSHNVSCAALLKSTKDVYAVRHCRTSMTTYAVHAGPRASDVLSRASDYFI